MKRRQKGQALAEFALIAPLFFFLLFGIIEAGRFIFFYETLANATREGARYAIVNGYRSFTPTGPDDGAGSYSSSDESGVAVQTKTRDAALGMVGSQITVDRCWWSNSLPCAFKEPGFDPTASPYDAGDANFLRGNFVTVRATFQYTTILPLPLPTITVQQESTLVINN